MLNEQVVNPVERASPAAIAIHLVEVEIKPEAFIRYFVAAKNNWPTIFFIVYAEQHREFVSNNKDFILGFIFCLIHRPIGPV